MTRRSPRLLLIKTGDSFPDIVAEHGDFEALFQARLPDYELTIWDAQRDTSAPEHAEVDAVLITGSHAMVSDAEPWSEALKPWLREAVVRDLPTLGVCYGHQLLAEALGGKSGYHPQGREAGTFEVALTEAGQADDLFGTLPGRFPAHLTHAQSVLTPPASSVVLASNAHDPYQALRLGPNQWSVQFHPEFTAPVMRAYLEHQSKGLGEAGQNVEALREGIRATSEANALIEHFIALLRTSSADSR
ncbi:MULTISPECIES: glutamine amidotransferase [Halomonadaceae]|uniref:glutamine amidotransferase n=1 Tax=Halomonadaceae TaxID=28256 RepID=UPI001581E5A5|nr:MULTISPECIES: glutamine amidotransferase [Halomonas]MDI4637477.1 glutamine amidotransferase [Halomonas sp. BMC7]NUJ61312.1 glutamine amidotransferase [Halomonas taeanensis]